MICYLEGLVIDVTGHHGVIKTRDGVGWGVVIHGRMGLRPGCWAQLWIESVISNGQISFFGATSLQEKHWFLHLTDVQGVGGRLAQHLLGVYTPCQLYTIILAQDEAALRHVEGFGPKLTKRLLHEMLIKIEKIAPPQEEVPPSFSISESGYSGHTAQGTYGHDQARDPQTQEQSSAMASHASDPGAMAERDAFLALKALGYEGAMAARAVSMARKKLKDASQDEPPVSWERLLKAAFEFIA